MTGPDAAATFARNLLAALVELGVHHVFVSPGSRNASLALAADAEPGLRTTMILDERSAGFVAVGAAKASSQPACVIATSGTATAHYYPAVIEALHARVPLIVITADRPPELRGTGAPQTIDQIGLYGNRVKLFVDTPVPDEPAAEGAHSLALRAYAAAMDLPPGPVHINVPLREPLIGVPRGSAPSPGSYHPGVAQMQPEALAELASSLSGRKAIIVAGGRQRSGFGAAVALYAAATGTPVIADPQCRYPTATTVSTGDLLAGAGLFDHHRPDFVLRLGSIPTSKPIWTWLETSGVEQAWIDDGPWRDPLGSANGVYRADPAAALAALAAAVDVVPAEWTTTWLLADQRAAESARAVIAAEPFPNEPAIASIVMRNAVTDSIVYAGSSMPIRDVDAFGGIPATRSQVLANRGANGIDGLLSAAAGASLEAGRAYVLAGDVAVAHDLGALATIAKQRLPVSIVVINNNGGGIFHFLPPADHPDVDPETFERIFGTPHGLEFASVAKAVGLPARSADHPEDLAEAISEPPEEPELIELRTDRRENVDVHRRIREAVAGEFAN